MFDTWDRAKPHEAAWKHMELHEIAWDPYQTA